MVAAIETTSDSGSRRRSLRPGLRNFRAASPRSFASEVYPDDLIYSCDIGMPLRLGGENRLSSIEPSAALPHYSNSRIPGSEFRRSHSGALIIDHCSLVIERSTGHRWSVYQHQQNAFQGGYFQSEEIDIQGLITAMRMIPGGQSAWDILQHHPGYAAGWAALDVVGLGGEELVTHGTTLLGRGLSAGASAALRPVFGAIGELEVLPYRQRLTFTVRLLLVS